MVVENSAANAFAPTQVTKGQRLAWVTQGLVLYIRGSLAPVWPALVSAYDAVMEMAAGFEAFRWSHEPGWHILDADTRPRLRWAIEDAVGSRPFWHVEVVNRRSFPDLSFEFADLHPTLGRERASFIRLRLPFSSDPAFLHRLTHKLATIIPFWFGTAGYQFNFLEEGREAAYDQIWAWARRYWAVEVVHTRTGTWDALAGVPRINWITLLGDEFVAELLAGRLIPPSSGRVEMIHLNRGLSLQAEQAPILGDMNTFEDVSAYVTVSKLLADAFVKEPFPFPGMFTDQKSTAAWIRRFLEPERWLDPDLD